jgi:hypothetical protein
MTTATFHDPQRPIVGRCPECDRYWTVRHLRDPDIAGTLPAHDVGRTPCPGGGKYPTDTRRG